MENLFDYLENIYNSSEKYQRDYELEDFITWFITTTFGFTGALREGFVDEDSGELVCEFVPDIKLDFKNKTIEIVVEE
jgi:hypothetical protein